MAIPPTTRAALGRMLPIAVGAIGLVILLLAMRAFAGSEGFAYDYRAYDAAARRIAAGEPLYPPGTAEAYNSGSYEGLYLYPPPLAVSLVPMTAIPPDAAAQVWLWLRLIVLLLGVAILPISWAARAGTFAAASVSFPVWYDLNLGNVSVLLFALSALIWRFRDHPLGGVALAIAGAIRYPFGIVVLGWLAARRWRQVAWTLAAGVVLGVATLPFVGIDGWLDYVAAVTSLGNVASGPHNLSLLTTAQALSLPGPSGLWTLLGIGAAVAATVYASWRRDPATAIVVSLTATILFFPFFHPHYLVQLLIPAAFLAGRGQWWGLVLPLLGWAPGEAMAPIVIIAVALPLLPARFLSLAHPADPPLSGDAPPLGAATGS